MTVQRAVAQSSGDVIADRRFAYGRELAADGDHGAAADLFAQTVELAPDWAAAWLHLGLARAEAGEPVEATAALRLAVALDRDGILGADLHLARVRGQRPSAMGAAFVAALFDQYADRFDSHLVAALGYRGPALLCDAMRRAAPASVLVEALDLGCGTGLMARAISGSLEAIDGVDLSPRMVAQARATGLYRHLRVGGLDAALADGPPARYDLILAADVFVYVGDLDAAFAGIARALRPAGLLAFTVQATAEAGYALGADLRFGHAHAYVDAALRRAGLTPRLIEPHSIREDRGVAVPGLVVVAARP